MTPIPLNHPPTQSRLTTYTGYAPRMIRSTSKLTNN
uniref:Uncharacterized protein n=1 Tax=Setaria italica TaxID=4555 RepID=K4AP36_SETIT